MALVAVFHHTPAPAAIWALQHQKAVIVERPVFTCESDAYELAAVADTSTGRAFWSFQRRHSPLNGFLRMDLPEVKPREYHCILFEEKLPRHQWYAWPDSDRFVKWVRLRPQAGGALEAAAASAGGGACWSLGSMASLALPFSCRILAGDGVQEPKTASPVERAPAWPKRPNCLRHIAGAPP